MLFDGNREPLAELTLRAEQAGVEQVHDRPQFAQMILDRRTGQCHAARRDQPAHRHAAGGQWVLDFLCFIKRHASPTDAPEVALVAMAQCIARDDDVARLRRLAEGFAAKATGTMMRQHLQNRRKALKLPAPVAQNARRHEQ